MGNPQLIGVVERTPEGPRVAYLNEPVPVTAELLQTTEPAPPAEVFRVAAACATGACAHFSGTACSLARRIVESLPAVVDSVPDCLVRSDCRWFSQEGAAACLRCPQVATQTVAHSEVYRELADPKPEMS
jgi:hypothetical protein